MRTPLLATILGLSLAACAGQIDDGGGGGDDVSESCGDGIVQAGEQCDDSNTLDGDGCSAACTNEVTPRLLVSVDKPTISTELLSTNMITVNLAAADGFEGMVNLTGTVTDATDTPIPGWDITFNNPTTTLLKNATANIVATLTIPSDSALLTGKVNIDVTSSLGTQSVTSEVTALQQVTFTIDLVNNLCVYPVNNTPVAIKAGTVVRFFNNGAANLEIHSNNNAAIPHQGQGAGADDPVTEPNTAYTHTLASPGAEFAWYCHAPGPDLGGNNPRISVLP